MKSKSLTLVTLSLLTIQACKRDIPPPSATPISCNIISGEQVLTDLFADSTLADYTVSCNISIQGNLTIQPGVVIEFAHDAGFTVADYGTINAVGQSSSRIVFKGKTDAPGSWKGIYFSGGSSNPSSLAYVTITGGGSSSFGADGELSNIRMESSSYVSINNCIITKSAGHGVYVLGNSASSEQPLAGFNDNNVSNNALFPLSIHPLSVSIIDNSNFYSGNGKQFVCLQGAQIENSLQWNPLSIPFFINGDMTIGDSFNNASLTVSPGCSLVFASAAGIIVKNNGFLRILGTSTKRITLTGESSVPGSWQGINIQTYLSNNQIEYADISYGGCCPFPNASSTDMANIMVGGFNAGRLSLRYCTIINSSHCGLTIKGSSLVSPNTGNTYAGNASGQTTCN